LFCEEKEKAKLQQKTQQCPNCCFCCPCLHCFHSSTSFLPHSNSGKTGFWPLFC
jgi:hypothetical protein